MNRPEKPEPGGRFWPTHKFHRYWFVAGLLLLLAWIAIWLDVMVARVANVVTVRGDLARILKLSEFFAHGFGIGVVLTGIWLLVPARRRFLPRLIISVLLPGAIVHAIKLLVSRQRPLVFFREFPASGWDTWRGWMPAQHEFHFNLDYASQSFPSAHTATALSFAIVMGWIFPRGRLLFLFLAILAAIQRIVFEAHWSSDVLAGAAVGVIVGSAMTRNWGLGYWCGLFEQATSLKIAATDETDDEIHSKSA
jgi:membrane-associated phospholipid phosphatase